MAKLNAFSTTHVGQNQYFLSPLSSLLPFSDERNPFQQSYEITIKVTNVYRNN